MATSWPKLTQGERFVLLIKLHVYREVVSAIVHVIKGQ